jgi:hypothetical protein
MSETEYIEEMQFESRPLGVHGPPEPEITTDETMDIDVGKTL